LKLKDSKFKDRKLRIEKGKEIKKETKEESTSGFISKKGVKPNLKK